MTKLESEEIKHAIYYEQYKSGVVKEILLALDVANREIKKAIKETDIVATKERYNELQKTISNIAKELRSKIEEKIDVDGVIEYELNKQKRLFNKNMDAKINVDFIFPTVEQIKKSALFMPVTPQATFYKFLKNIQDDLIDTWVIAVRTGYMTNETTQNIIKRVLGSVSPSRVMQPATMKAFINSVNRNTRTVLQSFANETRKTIYERNKDVIEKVKYLATLDRRTCLVCANYDGKIFSLDKAPILPLHYNCRCVLVPIINGLKDFTDTRPEEEGVTKGSITFTEWLAKQDSIIQRDVLGETRYKLYKQGVKLNDFIDNGKILTLEELNAKLFK